MECVLKVLLNELNVFDRGETKEPFSSGCATSSEHAYVDAEKLGNLKSEVSHEYGILLADELESGRESLVAGSFYWRTEHEDSFDEDVDDSDIITT
jgi:hypothetical protein